MSDHDPVPEGVRIELRRLEQRWAQLPLDQALRHTGAVHAYAAELALFDARHHAEPGADVSGLVREALGEPRPERVMDQLAAVLFDVFSGFSREVPGGACGEDEPPAVVERLVALRRGLS